VAGTGSISPMRGGGARPATVWAITVTATGLLGSGLGPQITGIVSDLLRPYAGAESLRWAMTGFGFLALWAAAHMALARRTYRADLARAEAG
jgi:hypothetical protein